MVRTEGSGELDRAAHLLKSYNTVAHVYELLRGYGNDPQVEPRDDGRWQRARVFTAKHRREYAVDLQTGVHSRGESHAGLIVAADSRADTPDELCRALVSVLRGADDRIVRGWLRAAAEGDRTASVPGGLNSRARTGPTAAVEGVDMGIH